MKKTTIPSKKTDKTTGSVVGFRSIEQLSHFRCGKCNHWWSIGDAPRNMNTWHCPWCGLRQKVTVQKSPKPQVKK